MNSKHYYETRLSSREKRLFGINVKFHASDLIKKYGSIYRALSQVSLDINSNKRALAAAEAVEAKDRNEHSPTGEWAQAFHAGKECRRILAFRIYRLKLVHKTIVEIQNEPSEPVLDEAAWNRLMEENFPNGI